MLDRRFQEASNAGYDLYTLVVRPPTNYHWIEGRSKFHEKLRDNIRVKYGCECYYRHYDEFDAGQRVHSHYIFVTNAPLDRDQFKATIKGLLAKVWAWVEKAMPPSLRRGHEDFFWDTQPWLAVEDDDTFDWSVYCQPPHNPTGLAKYLVKDLHDRSGVQPVPEGWPLNVRGGRGFFGQPIKDYWRGTYAAWYPPNQVPGSSVEDHAGGEQENAPQPHTHSTPERNGRHERLERIEEGTGPNRRAGLRLWQVRGLDRREGQPGQPWLSVLVLPEREDAARPDGRHHPCHAAGAAGVVGPAKPNIRAAALPRLSVYDLNHGPARLHFSPHRLHHDPGDGRDQFVPVVGVPAVVRGQRVRLVKEHVYDLTGDPLDLLLVVADRGPRPAARRSRRGDRRGRRPAPSRRQGGHPLGPPQPLRGRSVPRGRAVRLDGPAADAGNPPLAIIPLRGRSRQPIPPPAVSECGDAAVGHGVPSGASSSASGSTSFSAT